MDIHSFTSNFRGGGARTNLFLVEVANPVDASQDNIIPMRARAGSLPAWTTNELETKFMGRPVYYSGVRSVEPWNVTIVEDSDMKVRNALESWQNWLNLQKGNVRGFGVETDDAYKTIGKISQLDKLGNVLRVYSMFGFWLQHLGAVTMDWEQDAIMTYEATFRYDYFEVSDGTSGNAGESSNATISL